LIDKSENVVTPPPFSGAKAVCPDKVPFPGLVPIAKVMAVLKVRTVLPAISWTVTTTAGLIVAPGGLVAG